MSEQKNFENGMDQEPQKTDLDALFSQSFQELPPIDLGDIFPTASEEQTCAAQVMPAQTPQSVTPQETTQPAEPQAAPISEPAPQPAVQNAPVMSQTKAPNEPQASAAPQSNVVDLFGAVVAESAESNVDTLLASLANRPPVFEYGSIKDEINDPDMTFEQLRVKMADDLPELEARGHVSWNVIYGAANERVSDPDKTTIFEVKSKIEKSKKFKDALKKRKANDKEPVCTVRPTITAQKKGILPFPGYKAFVMSEEHAAEADKAITYFPSRDGRVYEYRSNEIGTFTAPATRIAELDAAEAGCTMRLPRLPAELLSQIIAFFRAVCRTHGKPVEALVNVFWDRTLQRYLLHVPPQKIGPASVETDLCAAPDPERYLHVMEVHSHNTMAAKFSQIDDADEQALRLYMVIGRLNRYYPDIRCRFACGGSHVEIPVEQVCERSTTPFRPEWLNAVRTEQEAA